MIEGQIDHSRLVNRMRIASKLLSAPVTIGYMLHNIPAKSIPYQETEVGMPW